MGGGSGGGGFRGTKGGKLRQHGRTPLNNQAQNRQTDAVASQLRLTKEQARELHDYITKQGFGYQEILEIARELFGK